MQNKLENTKGPSADTSSSLVNAQNTQENSGATASYPAATCSARVCHSCGELNRLPTGRLAEVSEGMLCLKCFDIAATKSYNMKLKQRLFDLHTMTLNLGFDKMFEKVLSNPMAGCQI